MNSKIIDGKPYMVGECRVRVIAGLEPMFGTPRDRTVVDRFDGETFVPLESTEAIDVHNKVLRDIYRRLDALESRK